MNSTRFHNLKSYLKVHPVNNKIQVMIVSINVIDKYGEEDTITERISGYNKHDCMRKYSSRLIDLEVQEFRIKDSILKFEQE